MTGFLYVLECNGFIKIGVTENVTLRVATLQTGNPYPIELLCKWHTSDPYDEERFWHNHLKQYRVRGEWFKLPDEIVADMIIKSIRYA